MATVRKYRGVSLGEHGTVEEGVLLGHQCRGEKEGKVSTLLIGDFHTIRSHSVLYTGSRIGEYFSTGHHALIREFVQIGNHVSIGSGTEIEQNTIIGNAVRIHSHCFVGEGTEIEDNVKIAPGVMISSDRHPLLPEKKKVRKGPRICMGAYIAMGAIILPGVTIGEGSFVAAGCVVVRSVPAGSIALGIAPKKFSRVASYLKMLEERLKGVPDFKEI